MEIRKICFIYAWLSLFVSAFAAAHSATETVHIKRLNVPWQEKKPITWTAEDENAFARSGYIKTINVDMDNFDDFKQTLKEAGARPDACLGGELCTQGKII